MSSTVPTKCCSAPGCKHGDEQQPITNFYVHTKNEDGSVRLYQSWCKDCQREATRIRASNRRRDAGINKRRSEVPYRIREGHRNTSSGGRDAVDAAPFARWLDEYLCHRPRDTPGVRTSSVRTIKDKQVDVGIGSAQLPRAQLTELARASGVSVRRLSAARKPGARISIHTADRVLTAVGIPLALIYPGH